MCCSNGGYTRFDGNIRFHLDGSVSVRQDPCRLELAVFSFMRSIKAIFQVGKPLLTAPQREEQRGVGPEEAGQEGGNRSGQ